MIISGIFESNKKISLNEKRHISFSTIEESIQISLKRKNIIRYYLPKRYFISIFSFVLYFLILLGIIYFCAMLKNNVLGIIYIIFADFELMLIFLLYSNINLVTSLGQQKKKEIYNFKKYFEVAQAKQLETSNMESNDTQISNNIMPYAVVFNVPFYWNKTFDKFLDDKLEDNYLFFCEDQQSLDFIFKAHYLAILLLTITTSNLKK